ncbi:MAG TPA: SpoIIE family protein phosphatase [Vicinamibacteria bacterium]|nr:SpoIIE family protein phosphatase [Vicinamibacteria bacterium]
MTTPVVFQYQQALDEFRREGREPPLLKRMSELISLLDLTTTLGSTLSGAEILDAALLIVMGELQVSRGALYVAEGEGLYRRRAARGLPASAPETLERREVEAAPFLPGPADPELAAFALICPVRKAGRPIALLGLGPRAEGRPFGPQETGFLESLAACAATPIENGLIYEELRRVNRSLSVKVYQLHNLFDIGRELTASLDEEAIERLVTTTVMGQFLASRCALYRLGPGGLELAHARGTKPGEVPPRVPGDPKELLRDLPTPRCVADLAPGPLRDALALLRFALAVPLAAGDRLSGLVAVGERPGGRGFGEEDLDFVAALARQTQAALEGARAHRVRLEKERQDRDLEIARGIQQSLFPRSAPRVEGFEIVAESRSCFQVGGDYYDFIPLDEGRLGLVIADVSGKGTPASLMMASVHAWLRAMAGTARPTQVLERLNRFLYASTQTSRYVTLFYAELDPARRRLAYVNAGHLPPHLVRADGPEERLTTGGPVLGLLEDVALEGGETGLLPGDLLATVTDGVTEAVSPAGEEFGDERVRRTLRASAGRGADATLDALVAAVDGWTGPAGCTDDLTALILRAT